jgi:hypothetical protein
VQDSVDDLAALLGHPVLVEDVESRSLWWSCSPRDIHPGAAALLGLTRPELLQTTEVLLRSGGDVPAASEQLHVHRTTRYYRIERVAEVTGVDLRGDPRLADLDVALKLARYRAVG